MIGLFRSSYSTSEEEQLVATTEVSDPNDVGALDNRVLVEIVIFGQVHRSWAVHGLVVGDFIHIVVEDFVATTVVTSTK